MAGEVRRPSMRRGRLLPVVLAGLLASSAAAVPTGATTNPSAILRNALLIRFNPSTPLAIGGESAVSAFLGPALSYYQGLSSANGSSFSSFSSSSSAAARRDLSSGKLDIALSSTPLNAIGTDVPDGQVAQYLQIPVAATAVALSYNISFPSSVTMTASVGGQQLTATTTDTCQALLTKYPLVLTPTTLSGIFSGQISQWSSSAIQASNPQLNFHAYVPVAAPYTSHGTSHPQKNQKQVVNCLRFATTPSISLYGPSTGSGVNSILTDYLSQVDPTDFPSVTDVTPAVVGTALTDSAAIAAAVSSTDGSLGYLPWSDAVAGGVSTARLQTTTKGVASNQALNTASVRRDLAAAATTIAADGGFSVLQGSSRYDVTNAGAGYPLVGLAFAITSRTPSSNVMGIATAKYLAWLSQAAPSGVSASFGQSFATASSASPLPLSIRQYDFSQLLTMSVNGTASLSASN